MTQQFIGGTSVPWPLPAFPRIQVNDAPGFSSNIIDAAGEMIAMVGRVFFAAGPGTSKTVSSAGGAIQYLTGTVTWAAATTFRVGLQNVSASAGPPARPVEDWVTGSPPYKDMIQGTDALSSNTWTTSAISTGSRTIAHGDLIAIVFDMSARAGADSVTIQGFGGITANVNHVPQVNLKTGGTWAQTIILPNVVITCDDGTLASLSGALPASAVATLTFSNASNPDEYGNIITPAGKFGTDELWSVVDPDGDFDMILYSDALNVTAPTAAQSVSLDLNQAASPNISHHRGNIPQVTLTPAAAYAVTVRPTSATTVRMIEVTVNAAGHLAFWPGGTGCYQCTRLNAAGALATTTTKRMLCGISINQVDDGASAGGGMRLAGHGGLAA